MKERPILLSGSMVRAVLEDRKNQTRRVLSFQPLDVLPMKKKSPVLWIGLMQTNPNKGHKFACRYGIPGDRLWVRETWGPCGGGFCYRASEKDGVKPDDGRWHPSIHMFRSASRLDLEIVSLRVERVQDISEKDAIAEGINCAEPFKVPYRGQYMATPELRYAFLWDSINKKKHPWDSNPWVWVIEFRRI